MVLLDDVVWDWIAQYDCSERYRKDLRQAFRSLLQPCGSDITMGSLPKALAKYREITRQKPRMFNKIRAAAQAYVRDTKGRHSNLWRAMSAVGSFQVPPQETHSVTPSELAERTITLDTPLRLMIWTMALTGMGPGEYWGPWELLDDRVRILGTHRAGRNRSVPKVTGNLVPPLVGYRLLGDALKRAGGIRLYVLRRSTSRWMEEAGIARTRRKLYMGHGTRDVTDLYEGHEVSQYLPEDAARLQQYCGDCTPKLEEQGG
jgi:hypothetical protein